MCRDEVRYASRPGLPLLFCTTALYDIEYMKSMQKHTTAEYCTLLRLNSAHVREVDVRLYQGHENDWNFVIGNITSFCFR